MGVPSVLRVGAVQRSVTLPSAVLVAVRETRIENAGSEAEALPSVTEMMMFE